MNREEKLKLSAEAEYNHAFKQGLFAKLYERSLWRFIHQTKALKPMQEKVKGGEPVLYGGLPLSSFEALAAENKLPGVEPMEYGWRWPAINDADWPDFAVWRAEVMVAAVPVKPAYSATIGERDILKEIMEFDLAGATPMRAMNAIDDWREYLRKR